MPKDRTPDALPALDGGSLQGHAEVVRGWAKHYLTGDPDFFEWVRAFEISLSRDSESNQTTVVLINEEVIRLIWEAIDV